MRTWDECIDLVEPGFIAFAVRKMAFGVVTASVNCAFDKTKCDVSFGFTGCDEVSGQGWAGMTGPDAITGKFEFHKGDNTTLEARRWSA